jgi:tetratricopeptide (TPR) repeat protein
MQEPTAGDTIISLLGRRLVSPPPAAAALERLAAAQRDYERAPSLEHTIWYGRRAAYLGQYARAIAIYSAGLERFPTAYQLYRHRGHRYISTRQLALAVADFARAAELAAGQPVELEPDGMPNRLNQPRSSGHFNVWYHLGLSNYLSGGFAQAAEAYRSCLGYCDNDDSLVATLDWLYMSERRLGNRDAAEALLAQVRPEMDLVESEDYHRRLLMYKGLIAPEALLPGLDQPGDEGALAAATQGYGVGNWYLYTGERAAALAIFERVLATSSWSAFGYIAAEVELARDTAA